MHISIPTYNIDTNTWDETIFDSKKDVIKYIDDQVKYPGEYNLKYAEGVWNEQGKLFQRTGTYPIYMAKSQDFKKHWDTEKAKSKYNSFIIYKKPSEGVEFALPSLYYFYLNYCPIVDKVKEKIDLPEIYDGDYHYFLYILRCILHRKYGVVLKKRQAGYTLKNMSILLNIIWFGEAAVSKIFASAISKVEDSWGFMTKYRDHINQHCGWKRGFEPGKILDWQIRRKNKDGSYRGNMSIAKGFTTQQDPTNGVGGNATVIFGEEAGINPTLHITHEYITSNVALGGLTTGLIIYSGAVGELEKAGPLKKFILNPEDNDFLPCPNNIPEDIEFGNTVGFFAPEWWNYVSVDEDTQEILKCYDKDGNTNKDLANREIDRQREKAKKKDPQSYRYYCSQRPRSIKEAFAIRKDAKFPMNLVEAQKRRIEEKLYPSICVDLSRSATGQVEWKETTKLPITEFPINMKREDKTGAIVVWERPIDKPAFGTYSGSLDPVSEGKTTTSDSLVSIYIMKNAVEVTKHTLDGIQTYIEPAKLVAAWCGRFDDLKKTHERLELLIEWYNAWTVVENNISLFIQYMISQRKQRYLVPKDQIMFLKDLGANKNVYQDYGWKNTGTLFKQHLLSYGIEFLKEELHVETKTDGEVVKITYGVERIPDPMLLEEMTAYQDDLNVDRLVSYCALVAFCSIQQSNRGYIKRYEASDNIHLNNKEKFTILSKSPFKHMGMNNSSSTMQRPPRNPYKNLK